MGKTSKAKSASASKKRVVKKSSVSKRRAADVTISSDQNGIGRSKKRKISHGGITENSRKKSIGTIAAIDDTDNLARPATKQQLIVFGSNDCGQLGEKPEVVEVRRPTELTIDGRDDTAAAVMHLSATDHTLIVYDDGKTFTCGDNSMGQLCRPTRSHEDDDEEKDDAEVYNQSIPCLVGRNGRFRCVFASAGGMISIMITTLGHVVASGGFRSEATGREYLFAENPRPVAFEGLEKGESVDKLYSGRDFCAALTSNGRVFTMGIAGPYLSRDCSEEVDFVFRPVDWGCDFVPRAQMVACGEDFMFILTKSGGVFACGGNKYGQLGLNDTADYNRLTRVTALDEKEIVSISAGLSHALFLSAMGCVFSCGRGDNGELGIEADIEAGMFKSTPTRVKLPPGFGEVKHICASQEYSIFASTNAVCSCGFGDGGRLGHGSDESERLPRIIDFGAAGLRIDEVSEISAGVSHVILHCTAERVAEPPSDTYVIRDDVGYSTVEDDEPNTVVPVGDSQPTLFEHFERQNANQGLWKCNTCSAHNPDDATKCKACNTPRPGHEAPDTAAAAAAVTAAPSAPSGGGISESGFTFGFGGSNAGASNNESNNAQGGFNFNLGRPTVASASSEGAAGSNGNGFSFGS